MIDTIRWLARLNSDACCQIENLFRESRTTEAFQNGVSQESQAAPSTSSHRPKSQRRLVTQRLAFLIAGFVTDEPVIKNQGVVLSRLF